MQGAEEFGRPIWQDSHDVEMTALAEIRQEAMMDGFQRGHLLPSDTNQERLAELQFSVEQKAGETQESSPRHR